MACVQGRLTKNVKDLLWLNEWDHKGGSDASAALKDLEVLTLVHLFLHDADLDPSSSTLSARLVNWQATQRACNAVQTPKDLLANV